ncbi:translation repressor RelB [Aquiluna sp.]|jgi:RHH-type transcriptional regulator, rel operon repressor / antitoxin RelB|nr:translation repressor RelB [Aquiluna sp.]MBT6400783.1 translation repressor RelB [Verrucomicrobiota bacterium]MDA7760930.1 translation repressor RelB [Aquiluna sp.]MDA9010347.1 translation repressor RelB [Aquiluna sp.]MDB4018696.1 translation repressor RelB [Aquiluna sp.]
MPKKQVNMRIEESLDQRLLALASRTGRTKSFYVAEALRIFLEDQEDYYLAKDSLREFNESGEDSIALKDIEWPSSTK